MTFAEIASRAIAPTLTIPQDLCYFIKASPPRKLSARVRFLVFFFYFFLLFFSVLLLLILLALPYRCDGPRRWSGVIDIRGLTAVSSRIFSRWEIFAKATTAC